MRWWRKRRPDPDAAGEPAVSAIDLHCHLLPAIDDGPPTMEATLAMARVARRGGTRAVVATPHVSTAFPANTADQIRRRVLEVRAALARADVELDVLQGAEVELAHALRLEDAELRALRLGGGSGLLVECPLSPASGREVTAGMRSLVERGHRVVLAHPERCPAFQRDPSALRGLVADGFVTCITAAALTGGFGRPVRTFTRALVREGLVHVVASDGHDAKQRPPAMRSHLEAAGLDARVAVVANPAAILAGRDVAPVVAPPRSPGDGQRGRGAARRAADAGAGGARHAP